MPKDPTRNVDRYKIRGGRLNKFDYSRQQTDLARENDEQEQSGKIPIPSEQSRAKRIKKLLNKYGESTPGAKKKKKTPKIKPLGEEAIPKKAGAARKKSIAKPVKKATTKAAKPVKKAAAKAAKPVKKATAKAAVARPAAKAASKKIAGKVAGKSPVRGKFASKPKSGRKGKRA